MDEKSPEQIFNKMMEQQQKQMNNLPPRPDMHNQQSFEEKRLLSQLQHNTSTPHVAPIAPTQGQCPQCNLFHPPVPHGQKCPNAPIKVQGLDTNKITDFLVKIKDILSSQLEQKGIKNFDKFGAGMVMVLMKYCEEYKDDEKV